VIECRLNRSRLCGETQKSEFHGESREDRGRERERERERKRERREREREKALELLLHPSASLSGCYHEKTIKTIKSKLTSQQSTNRKRTEQAINFFIEPVPRRVARLLLTQYTNRGKYV
jgi:hypothetical protein